MKNSTSIIYTFRLLILQIFNDTPVTPNPAYNSLVPQFKKFQVVSTDWNFFLVTLLIVLVTFVEILL